MEIEVVVAGQPVSASVHGAGRTTLVLAHGAGGRRTMPWLVAFAERMGGTGRRVLLHNFPYSEAGRARFDPPAVLEDTVGAFAAWSRETGAAAVVAGGRSMGGRMATQAVAKGLAVEALLLLAYPLHPPGEFDRLRDAHLPRVTVPMLFVQGTRDAFARADLLARTLERLGARATLLPVEGGDHSFSMPRTARRPVAEVRDEIARAADAWLAELAL
jgi:uncharacterized protein